MARPNNKPPLIANAWREYERLVLDPIGAGAVQRQETKRAFYFGALALFDGIIFGMTPGDEPRPPDIKLLDGIHEELREFTEYIKRHSV